MTVLQPGDVVVYAPPYADDDDPVLRGVVIALASHERGAFVRFQADGGAELCPLSTLKKA